jgi:outer membrane protein TolC
MAESARLVSDRLGMPVDWTSNGPAGELELATAQVLTADEAVARALHHNRELVADLQFIGQADADLLQASLLQNPIVNFMIMFPDGGGRAMLRAGGIPIQPLQDLWLIPARKSTAQAALQEAVLRVADRAIEIDAKVRGVYVRLQYAQRAAALLTESAELADRSTELVEARQVAGQATQVAVNLARLRSRRLRADLVAAEAEYRALQRELLELMGSADAPDTWTVTPLHELESPLPAPPDELRLIAMGRQARLDLQAAEWSVAAARERTTLRKREGWPELAVGMTFERMQAPAASGREPLAARAGNSLVQSAVSRATGSGMSAPMIAPWRVTPNDVTWTTGPMFDLEVPIFDQNQGQIARAERELLEQVARYEAREQAVVSEIRRAWIRNRQAYQQVTFYRQSVLPEVERNLALAEESFVAGEAGLLEYLQAQDDWIETRRTILVYLRDGLESGVELDRAVGGRVAIAGKTLLQSDGPHAGPSASESVPASLENPS